MYVIKKIKNKNKKNKTYSSFQSLIAQSEI